MTAVGIGIICDRIPAVIDRRSRKRTCRLSFHAYLGTSRGVRGLGRRRPDWFPGGRAYCCFRTVGAGLGLTFGTSCGLHRFGSAHFRFGRGSAAESATERERWAALSA